MNDESQEAFTKWFCLIWELYPSTYKNLLEGGTKFNSEYLFKFDVQNKAWQAACEYKKEEYSNLMDATTKTSQNNFKLQAENAKLKSIVMLAAEASCYTEYEDACGLAKQVLKELD